MISVIIPTYNRTRLLMDRAIPSLLAQTNPDWECLVVGDGTEEQTVVEMESLILTDRRFRFWNLAHDVYPEWQAWGLYGLTALNFGLDWARGEWISVLNDDDEYTPDNHEFLLAVAAVRKESDFVYGMSDTYKNGRPTGQFYGKYPPGDGSVTQGAYIYRRSLEYRYRHDCYDRGRNGDADMWIRMLEGGVTFSFNPRIVHHYHRNYP